MSASAAVQRTARSVALILDPRDALFLQREFHPAVAHQSHRRVMAVMNAHHEVRCSRHGRFQASPRNSSGRAR